MTDHDDVPVHELERLRNENARLAPERSHGRGQARRRKVEALR